MEQRLYLQMFADDAASTASDAKAGDNPAADAPADAPDKKTAGSDSQAKQTGKTYSDADVDKIIEKKFAEWQKKQEKAVNEAAKLAEMNAQEKAEYERDQLQRELDALKKQNSLVEMTKTARKMLSDADITVSDELLSMMVSENAEDTKVAVDGFAKAFKDAVESAVKERLRGEPPRRGMGGAPTMTKEQIMAIKDPELRQRKMLENKSLFPSLN